MSLLILCLPGFAAASTIGVGVGTGKIDVSEKLKPSFTYNLPSIAVFNNGDVQSDFEMTVQYNETQAEIKPPAEWITFSPQKFTLEPGKAQQVSVMVQPNYSAKPGKYFVYLEARPLKKDQTTSSSISVAAATKLQFEVMPANIFLRVYFAVAAFWTAHKQVLIPMITALVIIAIVILIRKYLNINIQRKKHPKKSSKDSEAS